MSLIKLFIVSSFFWEASDKEFGCILLLVSYLAVSGVELFTLVSEVSGLMFLLGLLGGMAVLMSFILKLCSPSKVNVSLPSIPAALTCLMVSVVVFWFSSTASESYKLLECFYLSNLMFSSGDGLWSVQHLVIIVVLISLLMVMLLVVEAIICPKQKGLL
nr:NADH dehydrogenase subunit 6 [Hoplopleura pacifica]